MSEISFKEVIEQTKRLIEEFEKREGKPWGIEGSMIELSKQVGELSQNVMMLENYYLSERKNNPKYKNASKQAVADELFDLFFMTVRIAKYYDIDLVKAHAYEMDKAYKWFEENK